MQIYRNRQLELSVLRGFVTHSICWIDDADVVEIRNHKDNMNAFVFTSAVMECF